MKAASARPVGGVGPDAAKRRPTLSREAPVFSRPTRPGQVPEKLVASSSGLSLPTTPSHGVRGVGPVDEDADHRVVDRAELGDRLVGPGQEAVDEVGLAAELLAGRARAARSSRELRQGPFVGLGAVIARPKMVIMSLTAAPPCRPFEEWAGRRRPSPGFRLRAQRPLSFMISPALSLVTVSVGRVIFFSIFSPFRSLRAWRRPSAPGVA